MLIGTRRWILGVLLTALSTVCAAAQDQPFTLRPEKTGIVAGEPLALHWRLPPALSQKVFLVVAIPQSARVKDSVYAIPAQARAPFSLVLFQDRSRIIVPVRPGKDDHRLEITVHQAGVHNIDWALVSIDAAASPPARAATLASGSFRIDVAYGSARFDADEQHPIGKADSTSLGPGSRHMLRRYKDHYQVIDTATGGLLASRIGQRATFSPQGRYVLSRHGFAGLDLFDLHTGHALALSSEEGWPGFGTVDHVVWVNGDALVLLSHTRGGAVTVALPLSGVLHQFPWISCNACSGYGSASLAIDLDRLVVGVGWRLGQVAEPEQLVSFGDEDGNAPAADFGRTAFLDTIATTGDGSDGVFWRSTDPFIFFPALAPPVARQDPALVKQARARAMRAHGSSVAVASPRHASSAHAAYREVQIGKERFSQDSAEASLFAAMEKHGLALRRAVQPRRTPVSFMNMSEPAIERSRRQATRALLAEMPRGSPAGKFIDELAPEARKQAFVSRGPTSLIRGEEDMREERKKNGDEPLRPLISESSLVEVSRLKAGGESIVLVQHLDSYGTSSDKYGDLVAVSIPASGFAPRILRLASHHTDDDSLPPSDEELQDISKPTIAVSTAPVDPGPRGDGRALGLAYQPELVIELALPDRLLVTSRLTGATVIYTVPGLERLARVSSNVNQGQLDRAYLLRDKPYLLRMSALGSFSVQHVDKPQLGASGRHVAGELVLFDRSDRFEMTDEAGQLLFLRVEGSPNLVPAEQFRAIAQKPGTIAATMGAGAESRSAGLAAPPLVEVRLENGDYFASAVSPSGLRSIDMLLDGVPTAQVALEGSTAANLFSRAADSQGRWTTFVARDSNGVTSLPTAIERPVPRYGGKLRVIALGVDRYRSPKVRDLRYAASDAIRVAKAALGVFKNRYNSVESLVVVDGSALLRSPELFEAEVRRQAQATGPRDVLLFFISAHGLSGPAGLEIALPSDKSGALQRLPFSTLALALNPARGRLFVFLDTCHAGGATHDAAIEQLTAINPTVAVIAASKGEQRSAEGPTWGGGVFTSAVIGAFQMSGRLGNSHFPDTDDLFGHIRAHVVGQTEGRQIPMLRVTRSVGPFALH